MQTQDTTAAEPTPPPRAAPARFHAARTGQPAATPGDNQRDKAGGKAGAGAGFAGQLAQALTAVPETGSAAPAQADPGVTTPAAPGPPAVFGVVPPPTLLTTATPVPNVVKAELPSLPAVRAEAPAAADSGPTPSDAPPAATPVLAVPLPPKPAPPPDPAATGHLPAAEATAAPPSKDVRTAKAASDSVKAPDKDARPDPARPPEPAAAPMMLPQGVEPSPPASPLGHLAAASQPPVADPKPAPPAHAAPAAAIPPPPAQQLAPALIAIGPAQAGMPQHLTIRLDPAELGRVQVRIERPTDGPAKVELAVERPDTLLLLLRDQTQLHRALDLAGVPPEGRTLHFSLAPPDPGAAPRADAGGSGSQARPDSHGQRRGTDRASQSGDNAAEDPGYPRPRPVWRRAGIDITA